MSVLGVLVSTEERVLTLLADFVANALRNGRVMYAISVSHCDNIWYGNPIDKYPSSVFNSCSRLNWNGKSTKTKQENRMLEHNKKIVQFIYVLKCKCVCVCVYALFLLFVLPFRFYVLWLVFTIPTQNDWFNAIYFVFFFFFNE